MVNSWYAKLLATRRVTQDNIGKKTAGVDGVKTLSPKERFELIGNLSIDGTAKPVRRVWIPKPGKKEMRPLGIPVIKDRVMQAVIKNALEPSCEALFEASSYGFRPGRSTHDAIAQCHHRLSKGKDLWVLDADIKGAFDNISHEYILKTIGEIPGKELIKQWLKAGYMENEIFHETESGTPQGGVISPLLANIALDGIHTILSQYTKHKEYQSTPKAKRQRVTKQKLPKYGFCR